MDNSTDERPPRPNVAECDPEQVPQGLRDHGRWTVWGHVWKNGKWVKKPYFETNQPKRWLSFNEACLQLANDSVTGAQGLAVLLGEGLAGIDLDKCRDPETGELNEQATEILSGFETTYAEVSPSGKGVHVLLLDARQPPVKQVTLHQVVNAAGEKMGIEVYAGAGRDGKGARFFTVTGDAFEEHGDVAAVPEAYWELCENVIWFKEQQRKKPTAKPASTAPPMPGEASPSAQILLRYADAARALVAVDPAVEGENGDTQTYKAAARMFEFVGDRPDLVYALLQPWNATCKPPWPHDELWEKIAHAQEYRQNDVKAYSEEQTMRGLVRARLDQTKRGEIKVHTDNILGILMHDQRWEGVLGYDEFYERVVKLKPPPLHRSDVGHWSEKDDLSELEGWLIREYEIQARPDLIARAVRRAAMRHRFHPVRDYLQSLVWDGTPRVDRWLQTYMNAADTKSNAWIGPRWLIAAVARAHATRLNLVKADCVLVFIGKEGAGKSTAFEILGRNWFIDSLSPLGSKDAFLELRGHWIIELSEIEKWLKDPAQAKSFFSSNKDNYRMPYDRDAEVYPRRCVFGGSTNEDQWIPLGSGYRRWWTVRIDDKVDLSALERDVDQLWAEAMVRYKAGEPHFAAKFTPDFVTEETKSHEQTDPWHDTILDWARERTAPFTVAEVLKEAIKEDISRRHRGQEMRIAATLKNAGYIRRLHTFPGAARQKWAYATPQMWSMHGHRA